MCPEIKKKFLLSYIKNPTELTIKLCCPYCTKLLSFVCTEPQTE